MLTTPAWPQWPMLRRAPSLSHASISNDLHRAVTVHRGVPDHRSRKRWFTPAAVKIVDEGLDELRAIVGPRSADLIRVSLWACLERCERGAAGAGGDASARVLGEYGFTVCCPPGPADCRTMVASRTGGQEPCGQVRAGYLPHRSEPGTRRALHQGGCDPSRDDHGPATDGASVRHYEAVAIPPGMITDYGESPSTARSPLLRSLH